MLKLETYCYNTLHFAVYLACIVFQKGNKLRSTISTFSGSLQRTNSSPRISREHSSLLPQTPQIYLTLIAARLRRRE